MTKSINDAISFYNKVFFDVIPFEIIDNKYFSYFYENADMPIWNTVFHCDDEQRVSLENISKFYDFYKTKKCNGYLMYFDDKFKEFSIYHGMFLGLKKQNFSSSTHKLDDFEIIETNDTEIFTKYLNLVFKMPEQTRVHVQNLMMNKEKRFYTRSYFAYYNKQICGTISITVSDQEDDAYLSNLCILPEFRKSSLSKQVLSELLKRFPEKNIYTLTEVNNVLSNSFLPELGFEKLGAIHLLDINKLFERIRYL